MLTGLQDVEREASYQAQCAQQRYASSGPPRPLAEQEGQCDSELSDDAEMASLLEATLSSFERLFASVGAAEMKAATALLAASPEGRLASSWANAA